MPRDCSPPVPGGGAVKRKVIMRIVLASPRGFCAGVNMAIASLDLALQAFGAPIYVYHEIVHNQHVVNSFHGGAPCS